jgi:hypothetical protein
VDWDCPSFRETGGGRSEGSRGINLERLVWSKEKTLRSCEGKSESIPWDLEGYMSDIHRLWRNIPLEERKGGVAKNPEC